MKRVDCRSAAGLARLTDAQYGRMLDLMDAFAVPMPDDPTAQTEADWQAARQQQAQLNAAADARQAWPEPQR